MPPPDRPARRQGIAGLVCGATGLVCFLLMTLLGPSVTEPALPGRPGTPPYSLDTAPSAYLAIGLTVAGILLSATGLALCLYAARRGWSIDPRTLMLAGAVAAAAFALMPPVGSGDHLNYAAYGRMVATGSDPYATTAAQLPGDPVARAVQDWRDAPTLYGPVATAQQTVASLIGRSSVRLTVFVMSVSNLLAFLAVGLMLYGAARGDPGRRLRAALLWTANPLLLFELMGGAHNDVLAIAFALGGLVVFAVPGALHPRAAVGRRLSRCLLAGLLIGVGASIKVNVAIVGGGPAWLTLADWWRTRRGGGARETVIAAGRMLALAGGAAAVTGVAYLMAGPHSTDQLNRASKSVSLATPWHLVAGTGGGLLMTVPRSVVQTGSALLTIVLAALLMRALPRPQVPAPSDPAGNEACRVAAALALAWLFAAPYALPWYDGLGWATIALLTWSDFDRLLIARTTVLALAYLPARDPRHAGLPGSLGWLVTDVRARLTPWALTLVLLALVVTALRRRRPAPSPGHSPQAPAESPS